MAVEIFYSPGGGFEERLTVEDDGSVTYWTSHNYKIEPSRSDCYTAEQAKRRFPQYASEIDAAVRSLGRSN